MTALLTARLREARITARLYVHANSFPCAFPAFAFMPGNVFGADIEGLHVFPGLYVRATA